MMYRESVAFWDYEYVDKQKGCGEHGSPHGRRRKSTVNFEERSKQATATGQSLPNVFNV